MSKGKGHIPIRTCITCGTKRVKKDLLRLILDKDGWVVPDVTGTAPGRGVYVCKSEECWSGLKNRKVLAKAFKGRGRLMFRTEDMALPNIDDA